jgi:hypothetical protein
MVTNRLKLPMVSRRFRPDRVKVLFHSPWISLIRPTRSALWIGVVVKAGIRSSNRQRQVRFRSPLPGWRASTAAEVEKMVSWFLSRFGVGRG